MNFTRDFVASGGITTEASEHNDKLGFKPLQFNLSEPNKLLDESYQKISPSTVDDNNKL